MTQFQLLVVTTAAVSVQFNLILQFYLVLKISERFMTEEHEWLVLDGDEAKLGITDYAQVTNQKNLKLMFNHSQSGVLLLELFSLALNGSL